jgi:hypothetical protein
MIHAKLVDHCDDRLPIGVVATGHAVLVATRSDSIAAQSATP